MPLRDTVRALIDLAFAKIPPASLRAHEITFERIPVLGSQRKYILSRPASRLPCPTIFVLHGTLANARMALVGMGFETLVDREQLVAVYPDAVARQWNDGHAPAAAWAGRPRDDVEFLRALAEHLARAGVSDPNRIYVTGFSSGGMMAFRLMCEAPGVFAAIAPVAATLPVALTRNCKAIPTPTLMINGTADKVVPFEGRKVSVVGRRLPSIEETISFLRKVNGCIDSVILDQMPGSGANVAIVCWTDSSSAAPVVLYRVEGGGHRIPSKGDGVPLANIVLGKMNRDFEAAEVIWNFFKDKLLKPDLTHTNKEYGRNPSGEVMLFSF